MWIELVQIYQDESDKLSGNLNTGLYWYEKLLYIMNSNRLVNSLYFTLAHQFLFLIFPSQPQDPQCFHISEESEVSWQAAGTSVKRNQKVSVPGSLFFALPFSCPSNCKIFCSLPHFSPTFCWSCVAPLQLHSLWYHSPANTFFLAFSGNDDSDCNQHCLDGSQVLPSWFDHHC